eukprot:CAMPEP_0180384318 /NCGR_PEP_ID=MMETSP0989-20121125/28459_1 /TAXON_ID=697907 /ORGANISM="non described non described, Strain CCMP2293" /LENGTH=466 /DNA_ID=CAMNT_0022384741 /DNA_START=29 /DNA_END=1429 /DNA_ORIENTATION=+
MAGRTPPARRETALRVLVVLLGVCALPCALGFGAILPVGVLQRNRNCRSRAACTAFCLLPGGRSAGGSAAAIAMSSSTSTTAPPPEKKTSSPGGFDGEKIGVRRFSLFPRSEDEEEEEMGEGPFTKKDQLYALYHTSDRLVVVQYSKKLCSMCRVIKPLVEKVMKEFVGRIHYADVEVTANKAVIPQAGLRGVPTVQMFYKGMMVGHWHGLNSKKAMRAMITAALGDYENASEEDVQDAYRSMCEKRECEVAASSGELDSIGLYPYKKIFATGRWIYPSRWNRLFENKSSEKGKTNRSIDRIKGLVTHPMLCDDNEHEDFEKALRIGALRPSTGSFTTLNRMGKPPVESEEWIEERYMSIARHYEVSVTTRTLPPAAQPPPGEKPQPIIGRITDGESNINYEKGGAKEPSEESGDDFGDPRSDEHAPARFTPSSAVTTEVFREKDGSLTHMVCDKTGCALVYSKII